MMLSEQKIRERSENGLETISLDDIEDIDDPDEELEDL